MNGTKKYRKAIKNNFLSNKKAVSVALTTMIITAGVLAAGIGILYWSFAWGNIARDQYSQAISQSQDSVGERLGFEYISYQNGQLIVNLINCGSTGDLKLARVYVWDSSHNLMSTSNSPTLKDISTDQQVTDNQGQNGLDVGKEGYIAIAGTLDPGYYTVTVITERGRNFDSTFSVQFS
jgi:hypothetical protein